MSRPPSSFTASPSSTVSCDGGFTGDLPWIGAMVGLPWTAHGVVCTAYLSLCKSDHKEGGITYEAAKAVNFNAPQEPEGSIDSPAI